jgi:hypothetical protein
MNEKKNQHSLLEQRLRSERPLFSPRERFTERVMDSLPPRLNRPRPSVTIPWPRVVLALAATACIALALAKLLPRDANFPPDPVSVNTQPSAAPALNLPNVSITQVQDLVAKLDEPLQNELNNVISDTRQAIQFIASNFLPEN